MNPRIALHRAAVTRADNYRGDADAALIMRLLTHPALMLLSVGERRSYEKEALESVARLERLARPK